VDADVPGVGIWAKEITGKMLPTFVFDSTLLPSSQRDFQATPRGGVEFDFVARSDEARLVLCMVYSMFRCIEAGPSGCWLGHLPMRSAPGRKGLR